MSETIEEAVAETAEAPVAEAPAAKVAQPRRRGVYDTEHGAVQVSEQDKEDVTYSYADLPDTVKAYLSLHGLWMFLRAGDTPDAAYAGLKEGKLPVVREGGKAEEVSPWRKATAVTLVEMTKKRETPMTMEQALERVSKLTRKELAAARLDPAIIKTHKKLFGTSDKEAPSLLAGLAAE